jgi:hypothetical protein
MNVAVTFARRFFQLGTVENFDFSASVSDQPFVAKRLRDERQARTINAEMKRDLFLRRRESVFFHAVV